MTKLLAITLLAISASAFAQLIQLSPSEKIKASDINHNFSYIKSAFLLRNGNVDFASFSSGELISKENLENEFAKVRILGVEVDSPESDKIQSAHLNAAFSQMLLGANSFDDVPVARNSSASFNEDSSYTGTFDLTNLIGTSQAQITSLPLHGNLVPNGTSFSYVPHLNYNGLDSFSFKIFDGRNYSSEATVSLSIIAVNDAPSTTGSSLVVTEDTPLVINLTASDVDLNPLTYSIVSSPGKGTLSISGNSVTYTPNLNIVGTDSFSFKANDGSVDSNTSTISLTISPVNDAPVASALQNFNVDINSSYTNSITVVDPDSSNFTYSISSQSLNGVASVSNLGVLTYTPALNYFGADSFSIVVSDGILSSPALNFTVNVVGKGVIEVAGVKRYYDGSFASSCNDYFTRNVSNYTYTGATGSGVYKVGASSTLTCDMTTSGGPWTMRTAWNTSTYPSLMLAGKIFATGNQSSTEAHVVPAATRLVGLFTNTQPQLNNMAGKTAYTTTGYSQHTGIGRFNFYNTTTTHNISQGHDLWIKIGMPAYDSSIAVFANGMVSRVTNISNGVSNEAAYIYGFSVGSSAIFWVKED